MMIFGVVYDDNSTPPASRAGLPEAFEKYMERHGVKLSLLPLENQFSITQANSSEIAHALASGMMQQHRVLFFRRNPHQATRSILLKMDFIARPQIDFRISDQPSEFFYMPSDFQDRPEQSEAGAYAGESQRT